eukprot:76937-Amphidinium_carterae.1
MNRWKKGLGERVRAEQGDMEKEKRDIQKSMLLCEALLHLSSVNWMCTTRHYLWLANRAMVIE